MCRVEGVEEGAFCVEDLLTDELLSTSAPERSEAFWGGGFVPEVCTGFPESYTRESGSASPAWTRGESPPRGIAEARLGRSGA